MVYRHLLLVPSEIIILLKKKESEIQLLLGSRHSAAATAKSLQSCPTLCNPVDGSPPGSPSLGFSRQEHWSGLPFPSPMHESEKWKWSRSVVSDSVRPHGQQPTRLLRPQNSLGKSTGVGGHNEVSSDMKWYCYKNLKAWINKLTANFFGVSWKIN